MTKTFQKFEPAPRRGEPEAAKRTPDYVSEVCWGWGRLCDIQEGMGRVNDILHPPHHNGPTQLTLPPSSFLYPNPYSILPPKKRTRSSFDDGRCRLRAAAEQRLAGGSCECLWPPGLNVCWRRWSVRAACLCCRCSSGGAFQGVRVRRVQAGSPCKYCNKRVLTLWVAVAERRAAILARNEGRREGAQQPGCQGRPSSCCTHYFRAAHFITSDWQADGFGDLRP
jgi:hypothetical protein